MSVTPSPTASTTPATSSPTPRGSFPGKSPLHSAQSAGLRPQACTLARMRPAAGLGTGARSAFQLDGHLQEIVFGRLPSVIHIPAHADQAAVLRWGLERFAAEVRNRNPGRALMLTHLAPVLLLQTFRGYLASAERERNWFAALSDPRLAKAIAAMQSDYARSWSLDELACTAGLSRAGFALNFKQWIGVTPMEYLTQWRMQIAGDLLRDEGRRIAAVATAVGYESESAFSVAFTRIVGDRPGHYRQRMAVPPAPCAAPRRGAHPSALGSSRKLTDLTRECYQKS